MKNVVFTVMIVLLSLSSCKPIQTPQESDLFQATGTPQSGKLLYGRELPSLVDKDRDPYVIFANRKRTRENYYFGTIEIIAPIQMAAIRLKEMFNREPLLIGDISKDGGGWIGHGSHYNGTDVDIKYPTKSGFSRPELTKTKTVGGFTDLEYLAVNRFRPGNRKGMIGTSSVAESDIDYPQTARLLMELDKAARLFTRNRTYITHVFATGPRVGKLRTALRNVGYPQLASPSIVMNEPYHDDHIHVRFRPVASDEMADFATLIGRDLAYTGGSGNLDRIAAQIQDQALQRKIMAVVSGGAASDDDDVGDFVRQRYASTPADSLRDLILTPGAPIFKAGEDTVLYQEDSKPTKIAAIDVLASRDKMYVEDLNGEFIGLGLVEVQHLNVEEPINCRGSFNKDDRDIRVIIADSVVPAKNNGRFEASKDLNEAADVVLSEGDLVKVKKRIGKWARVKTNDNKTVMVHRGYLLHAATVCKEVTRQTRSQSWSSESATTSTRDNCDGQIFGC